MFDKMKQMMQMKKQADKLKKQLEKETVEVTDVKGINIVISGAQTFKSFEIDEDLLKPENKARFERELLKSVNIATRKAQNIAAVRMRDFTGLNLPGM